MFLCLTLALLIAERVSASPILIGGLWDLSGDQHREGRAALMAAERAIELLNFQGGIDGRRLKLVTADTRGEPGRLLLEARNLTEDSRVMVLLGPSNEVLARVLKDYAEAHEMPVVLTAGYEPLLCSKKKSIRWTFSVSIGLRSTIKAMFHRIARSHLGPVVPLVADSPKGKRISLWIQGYGPEYRLHVLPAQNFGLQDTDVVTQLQQSIEEGARTVIAWGPKNLGPVLLHSARGMAIHIAVPVQLFSSHMLKEYRAPLSLWTAAPPILLGHDLAPSHPCAFVVGRFLESFKGKMKGLSVEEILSAGEAWDAVHLVTLGLRRSLPGLSREGLRSAIEDLKQRYYGVMGVFRPNKRDHSGLMPASLVVLEWTKDGWRPVTS
ncbi:MAG: ABC transporter substrate-binding protein [Nitrospiraceae bacterium]|nr:ABC transporter substrate-binding protein [Nitrospiraceae bacterium]